MVDLDKCVGERMEERETKKIVCANFNKEERENQYIGDHNLI